jgi:hypothetical protein
MMHHQQRAAFLMALATLRRHCGALEFGLRTYANIAEYLNRIGVKTGRGNPVTARTVRGWHQKRGLPITTIGKGNGAWTSNLLLLAWLSSYGEYQRTKPRYPTNPQREATPSAPLPPASDDGWVKAVPGAAENIYMSRR